MSLKDLLLPFWQVIKFLLPLIILAILIKKLEEIPHWISAYRAKAAGIDKVDSMTGDQFEVWLAHQFKLAGYKVKRTRYRCDHGADMILTDRKGSRTAVQAKKLAKRKDHVGAPALGEVLRGKKYYECDKAMVVTNQSYTQQARDEARKMDIILVDRERLIAFVEKIAKSNKK